MSIFSTPISSLGTADLEELLGDNAAENIRLEFKREPPTKDEMLKKLSSFANTFGGYVVIGAEARNDGRITGLRGVEVQNRYKQTIVQWCTGGAMPPLTVEISDPILVPAGNGRVCYVVGISESEFAPHFLNGRKGVYVRTDEFSSRFEPLLATESELRYLLDRRRLIRERRTAFLERAHQRFQIFCKQRDSADNPQGGKPLPAFFTLTLVPRYPTKPVAEHAALLSLLERTSVPWRMVGFPRNRRMISQHESALVLQAGGPRSLVEANIWGMLSYATGIAEERNDFQGIHTSQFIGYVLVFLGHAAQIVRALSLTGSLHIEARLEGVRGIPWVHFSNHFPEHGACSEIDDAVTLTLDATTEQLTQARDSLAIDILRLVFFAVGWPGTADDPKKLASLLNVGYEFNHWPQPDG